VRLPRLGAAGYSLICQWRTLLWRRSCVKCPPRVSIVHWQRQCACHYVTLFVNAAREAHFSILWCCRLGATRRRQTDYNILMHAVYIVSARWRCVNCLLHYSGYLQISLSLRQYTCSLTGWVPSTKTRRTSFWPVTTKTFLTVKLNLWLGITSSRVTERAPRMPSVAHSSALQTTVLIRCNVLVHTVAKLLQSSTFFMSVTQKSRLSMNSFQIHLHRFEELHRFTKFCPDVTVHWRCGYWVAFALIPALVTKHFKSVFHFSCSCCSATDYIRWDVYHYHIKWSRHRGFIT